MSESDSLSDHERRLDEIGVLECIFSKDEIKMSEEHGPAAGQFYAHIELPKGFRVVTKSKMEDTLDVSFLPPIVLHFSLPERYPSDPLAPPSFTLACPWLVRAQLGKLCEKLDVLWKKNHEDGQGSEILYIWTQFLKNESLDFLNIEDQLDVGPIENAYCRYVSRQRNEGSVGVEPSTKENKQCVVKEPDGGNTALACFQPTPAKKVLDCRAVIDLTLNMSIMSHLATYNETRLQQEFCRQPHECNVCYDTKLGCHFTRFHPCGHFLCSACATAYFSTVIEGGKVQNISCPEPGCDTEVHLNQIKDHLSPELFLRYDRLLLDATLATLGDIITCPRPTCQYSVTMDQDKKMATCFHCKYNFCVDCRKGYHGVEPCRFKANEERQLVEEYSQAGDQRRLELEKRYSKRRLEELVQSSMTRTWIEDNSKQCPHCKALIQKSAGCNKMICLKCGTNFCWLCGVRIDPDLPYLHYLELGSPCYRLLFQGVDVNEGADVEVEDEDENLPEHLEPAWLNEVLVPDLPRNR